MNLLVQKVLSTFWTLILKESDTASESARKPTESVDNDNAYHYVNCLQAMDEDKSGAV